MPAIFAFYQELSQHPPTTVLPYNETVAQVRETAVEFGKCLLQSEVSVLTDGKFLQLEHNLLTVLQEKSCFMELGISTVLFFYFSQRRNREKHTSILKEKTNKTTK